MLGIFGWRKSHYTAANLHFILSWLSTVKRQVRGSPVCVYMCVTIHTQVAFILPCHPPQCYFSTLEKHGYRCNFSGNLLKMAAAL
ncbi:hypothetical protein FKM82_023915 [Ascaphus truei]